MHQTLANGDGGGNVPPTPTITVRRIAAIGDCIAASVVADKLHERRMPVIFQAHPMIHPILRRCPSIAAVTHPDGAVDVNLDAIYEKDSDRKTRHFHSYFVGGANNQLRSRGIDLGPPLNCRPTLIVNTNERALVEKVLAKYPRPWVFIVPKSQWFQGRQVPEYIWQEAAKKIKGTKFWLGMDPCADGIVDLKCTQIEQVCVFLSAADLLISTDTGPAHIAIAQGIQTLIIGQSSDPILHFSDLCDFEVIYAPVECLNCQENRCPINQFIPPCQTIDPALIAAAANRKLRRDIISCVIPTFNAPVDRLTRCVEAVLPQVDEIIVTTDAGGKFPAGAPGHPKVRYVKSNRPNLGFGKNCNFGIRHSSGSQILLLNDDAFLNPDCVARLKEHVAPNIGIVSHLLRYESGKIYFAGRQRQPGERGCHHIDHNGWHPTFQKPMEMEAVSATSILINREAFYKARCFNERFHMYAEDDCLSLAVRKQGYKLVYTPHATGTHQGNATSGPTGQMHRWIQDSGKLMEELWGPYFDHNINRIPGTFDYS